MDVPYDDSLDPPAPVLTVELRRPGSEASTLVSMLVDTGADASVLPRSVALTVGLVRVAEVEVTGVTGSPIQAPVFDGAIVVAGHQLKVEFVGVGEEAILGRDVLERLVVRLDGPRGRLRVTAPRRRKGR